MIDKRIEKYIEDHTSDEDSVLYRINRETNLRTTLPRMLSGKVQGKFLEILSKMVNPEIIVEIGTFTGYSAICLAKGLREGGRLYTIESNPELEDIIREFIKNAGMDSKIELKMGDARQILKDFNNPIDLVFMDADKSEYLDYYKLIVPLLKKGGIIIADNVLWSGKVISDKPDRESIALNNFNDYVSRDNSVEQVMLSVRDGLYVIRKL